MMTRSHHDRRAFLVRVAKRPMVCTNKNVYDFESNRATKKPASVRAYGRNLYEHNRVSGTLCAISQIKTRKATDIKIISVDRQRVNTILIVAILNDTGAVLSLDHACCLTMVLPFFRPLLQIICRCEVIVISTFTERVSFNHLVRVASHNLFVHSYTFEQTLPSGKFRIRYYTALE
ncbi:hypothetical protein ARMSODRAFT_457524 [Armillaria solidipes]|uniref:Uncharacterized protein n=1 Tax=Armillaria solidipes TaxID=1076256 RepID=A0A2H3BCA9_9AGAR|nr:hypothetical protein ARMSODRAFT_457524 [Armillaria solidipes]